MMPRLATARYIVALSIPPHAQGFPHRAGYLARDSFDRPHERYYPRLYRERELAAHWTEEEVQQIRALVESHCAWLLLSDPLA